MSGFVRSASALVWSSGDGVRLVLRDGILGLQTRPERGAVGLLFDVIVTRCPGSSGCGSAQVRPAKARDLTAPRPAPAPRAPSRSESRRYDPPYPSHAPHHEATSRTRTPPRRSRSSAAQRPAQDPRSTPPNSRPCRRARSRCGPRGGHTLDLVARCPCQASSQDQDPLRRGSGMARHRPRDTYRAPEPPRTTPRGEASERCATCSMPPQRRSSGNSSVGHFALASPGCNHCLEIVAPPGSSLRRCIERTHRQSPRHA